MTRRQAGFERGQGHRLSERKSASKLARALRYGEEWRELRAQGKYNRLEGPWDEHTAYIRNLEKVITPTLESELKALATPVQCDGPLVVVFNPLPWKRTGLVSVPPDAKGFTALEPAGGGEPSALDWHDSVASFVARDIPALGYRTFVPLKAHLATSGLTSDTRGATLESPFFKTQPDPARGVIRSLIAKPSGRELVDAPAPEALRQYLYERFDSNHVQAFVKAYVKISADWATNELGKPNLPLSSEVPYQALSPTNFLITIRETPIGVMARQGSGPMARSRLALFTAECFRPSVSSRPARQHHRSRTRHRSGSQSPFARSEYRPLCHGPQRDRGRLVRAGQSIAES